MQQIFSPYLLKFLTATVLADEVVGPPYSAADFATARAAASFSFLSTASVPPRVSANNSRSSNPSSDGGVNARSV